MLRTKVIVVNKYAAFISVSLLVALSVAGCDRFKLQKEVVEYKDTDIVALGLTPGRSIQEIASDLSNVTVFCQRHTRHWDCGRRLDRIQGFHRIGSFDDRDTFARIMERCMLVQKDRTGGSRVLNQDLPMYYIVFYYWEKNHVMVFPVKFDERLSGHITPWQEYTRYTYSNKDLFRWLKELDQKWAEKTDEQKGL